MLPVLFIVTACKKYEEGPLISLRSKKERVSNTWKVDRYFEDGNEKDSPYPDDHTLKLDKDGNAKENNPIAIIGGDWEGEWEFRSDKEEIYLENDNGDEIYHWEILRLKEDEFWVAKEDDNNDKIYFEPD